MDASALLVDIVSVAKDELVAAIVLEIDEIKEEDNDEVAPILARRSDENRFVEKA